MNASSAFLDPVFQRDITCAIDENVNVGGSPLRFEHLAVCAIGKGTMRNDLDRYLAYGYTLVKDAGAVIFIEKGSTRIELIPHDAVEHVGYIVPYGQLGIPNYKRYVDCFCNQVNELGKTWILIETDADSTRAYTIFSHVATGLHFQLLHREQALFPCLW